MRGSSIFNCMTLNTMRNILLILFLLVAGISIQKSSAQAVILKADTVQVACTSSDTFLVPIRLDNFTNVSGLQFTLQWDTAKLDYAYVSMLHPQFVGVGFDTSAATIALGKLTFAWTDLAGLSLPSNTILFKVAFRRIGGTQAPISFTNDPTAIAVFDNQFNEQTYQTFPGAVQPIDNVLPTITCPANVQVSAAGPVAIPNIPPVLSDNCGTPSAGWSVTGATTGNFPNDPDASGATFNLGASIVTYKATDAGGNTATCSFQVNVDFAISNTDLTLIAVPDNASTCGELVTINVLAYNFNDIAGLQFSMAWLPSLLEFDNISNFNSGLNITINNFNTDSTGVGGLSFAWTSASLNGSSVPDSTVLFTLTYTVQGNGTVGFSNTPTAALAFTGTVFPPEETPLQTYDATVAVVDNMPPAITCPADITVQAPGTTAVSGIAPSSVTDNCSDPSVGYTISGVTSGAYPNDPDASGSLFNVGTSTVTYTATDAGSNTATCSFNVTVEFSAGTDLTIVANGANAACGGSFSVDFTALNFQTVAGVQFTILWDPAIFQYTSVSNFNLPLGINISNFGIDNTGMGFITFAWTSSDLNGLSVNNGDLLFRLNFNLLNSTSSTITFSDDPTARLAFDGGSFLEIPMVTVDGQVSVNDNIPPTITCPASVNVPANSGQLFATVTGLTPTVSDNCGGTPSVTYNATGATTASGTGNADGNYNAGTTTVTYTATDANGNTATCSFQVVVDAGTPVILSIDTLNLGCQGAPSQIVIDITVQNFVDIIGLSFGLDWDEQVLQIVPPPSLFQITAGPPPFFVNVANGTLAFFGGHPDWPDVPNGSTIIQLTFNVLNPNALNTTHIAFTGPFQALDGNFADVPVQTIDGAFAFTLDNVPPHLVCPNDTILMAPLNQCDASYTPVAPVATDACGTVASITIAPNITTFPSSAPTVLTYTATDNSGNSASCTTKVTVVENNPPQASGCPQGPILANADAMCHGTATWTEPTFQDACNQTGLTQTNNFAPGDFFPVGTTTVVYEATDNTGNKATCTFEVQVSDVTAPTITCPADTTIIPIDGCSATVDYPAPLVSDNCSTNLTITYSKASGTTFIGITPVTCSVVDNGNNTAQCTFIVTVKDATPPIFTTGCPKDTVVNSASGNCGANPIWLSPAVTDNCDQSVALVSAPASGTFLAAQPTPHTITFTATDDFGNSATCTFTITVKDNTAPVLANCPTQNFLIFLPTTKCDTTLNWNVPTVNDNCGAGFVTLDANIQPPYTFTTGDTMVVYTATDASGNSASCFFNVSVRDVVPPSFINCPTQPIVVPNGNPCGTVVDFPLPVGMDNCTPTDQLVYTSDYQPLDTFPVGTTIFPYRVTDASGNFEECDITIMVVGQVAGFINVPANINIEMCHPVVSWTPPTPVGFCPPVNVVQTPLPPGSIFPFGVTTVTYTASDGLNSASTSFTVTVTEHEVPVFTCPTHPITVSIGGEIISDPDDFLTDADTVAGCAGVELLFNDPAATDNCVTPTVSLLQGQPSGSVFPVGFNNLVFRAVDSSGNVAQCAVFIEVQALPALDAAVQPSPGCEGATVTITTTNIPGATYTWNGPLTSNTNVLTINGLNKQNDGQYIVTAQVNGCNTMPDTAIVYLTEPPTAENDLFYEIDPGQTVTFPVSVLENDMLSPAFDFSICETSQLSGLEMNTADGTFSYTAGDQPGMVSFLYTVCSRTCDLKDQAAVTIRIRDTKCAFIPNIITPNGDDINDWLSIPCIDTRLFNENSIVIYNQWGDKVYEASPYSNDQDKAWRGTLDGEPGKDLPDGVYYYIFKPGPNDPTMKGFIEIFR